MRPTSVTIVEVGPRDGLQNEAAPIPTAQKIEFVDRLSAASLPVIEVSAFVSARWVPQMSDADAVFAGITRAPGTRYAALVPNLTGLERARAAGVGEIGLFAAASEQFSKRNINQTIDESLAQYRDTCARAKELGIRVRGYVSTAFGCPFEGDVPRVAGCGCRRSTDRNGCVRGGGQRHHRYRPPGTGSTRRRRGSRAHSTRTDCAAFSRHARHGAGKRPDSARPRHRNVRCVRRRARRMPVRSRRNGQRRHRGSRVHVARVWASARASTSMPWSRHRLSSSRWSGTRFRRATIRPHESAKTSA